MIFFLAIILPTIGYFFQVFPRLFNRYYGVDVWMRMIEADLIRNNNHKIPKNLIKGQFMLEGYFTYPPFLPWLLSFFSRKRLLKIQGFISPFFDATQNLLIFYITFAIFDKIEIALLAQAMYISIPLIILENSYLTPRSLGYLLFTLSFFPLILFSFSPLPIYLVFSIGAIALCCLTHKFALQSLFFISAFFSLLEFTPIYILVFIAALGIALVISKGFYLRVLSEHLSYIKFSSVIIKYRFAHQVRGITSTKKMDFVGKVYKLLGIFSPLPLVLSNIWIIPPIVVLLDFYIDLNLLLVDPLIIKLSIWASFFYIFSSLVLAIPWLRAIGEGQRYMEMGTVPSVIVSAVISYQLLQTPFRSYVLLGLIFTILAHLSIALFLQIKAVIKDKNRTRTDSMNKVFSFINKITPRPNILCIPHQITTMVLFNTKANVMVDIQPRTALKIWDVYPVLRKPVKEIARKFNLNLLVLKKDYASLEELKLSKKSILFETIDTVICKI